MINKISINLSKFPNKELEKFSRRLEKEGGYSHEVNYDAILKYANMGGFFLSYYLGKRSFNAVRLETDKDLNSQTYIVNSFKDFDTQMNKASQKAAE